MAAVSSMPAAVDRAFSNGTSGGVGMKAMAKIDAVADGRAVAVKNPGGGTSLVSNAAATTSAAAAAVGEVPEADTHAGGSGEASSEEAANTHARAQLAQAVTVLLAGLGEDPTREGLRETPQRVAKALQYAARGYRMSPAEELGQAVFAEEAVALGDAAQQLGNVVLVRDIEFYSTHKADLMPFYGRAHVAYVPQSGQVVGLSKFARITQVFSARLQTPDALASQLADALQELIAPQGVAVVLHTRHLSHTAAEGVHRTATAAHGCFTQETQWAEMVALLGTSADASPAAPLLPHQGFVHAAVTAERPPPPPACSTPMARARADATAAMDASAHELLRWLQPTPAPRGNGLLHSRGEWAVGAATAEEFVRNMLAATRGAPRAVPQLAWPWLAQWAPSPSPSPSLAPTLCWETHLPVHSLCEHHLLPFHGIAHVAYVPGVAGRLPRSLVADMVAVYAQRLSVQERLTRQLAHAVTAAATLPRAVVEAATGAEVLEQLPACSMTAGWTGSPSHPRQPGEPQPSHTADGDGNVAWGAMVVVHAGHLCMLARGVQNTTAMTTTRVVLGALAQSPDARLAVLRQMPQQPHEGFRLHGCSCCPAT